MSYKHIGNPSKESLKIEKDRELFLHNTAKKFSKGTPYEKILEG